MKGALPWILTGALGLGLVLVLLMPPSCPGNIIERDTVTVTKILTDTVYRIVERHVPTVVNKTDTVVLGADTAALLAMYNKTYHYSDTIADSCLIAVIDDQVFRNIIVKRGFKYSNLCKQETQVFSSVFARGFYVGPLIGGSTKSFAIGGTGMYTWNKNAVSLNIDALSREVQVSYLFRVGRQ